MSCSPKGLGVQGHRAIRTESWLKCKWGPEKLPEQFPELFQRTAPSVNGTLIITLQVCVMHVEFSSDIVYCFKCLSQSVCQGSIF